MPDWQKDLIELWESIVWIADEIGSGIQDLAEEIAETVTADLEVISTEIKNLWWLEEEEPRPDNLREDSTELFDSSNLFDFSSLSDEDWPMYYEPRQEANGDFHPACVGCRNYNGTTFGGNLLVCGFHPYGWAEGACPDWEAQ